MRFNSVVACSSIIFFLNYCEAVRLRLYHIYSPESVVDGHSGFLQVLAIMNRAADGILLRGYLQTLFLGVHPDVGLPGHGAHGCFVIVGTAEQFFSKCILVILIL